MRLRSSVPERKLSYNAGDLKQIVINIETMSGFLGRIEVILTLSFEQLKSMVIFAQVVDQGSFSAAARHLGLTRAVVSYHIKRLESQLQVSLLNRTTRSISLTDAGKHYYEHCHLIATEAEAAQKQLEHLRDDIAGRLKITCPVNAGLQLVVPALNQFKQRYPQLEMDVILTDEVVNIIQEGIDLAIRGAPLVDSGLQATRLSAMETMICGAPVYFRKQGRPLGASDLSSHQWVTYSASSPHLQLSRNGKQYMVAMQGSLHTNNAAARTAFVVGGHGLGRIPAYEARPLLQQGKLEQVLPDYQLPEITIYGVFPPRATSSKKVRLLVDYMKAYFMG
jgi:DNA-binding transcriptional LysR family regulator